MQELSLEEMNELAWSIISALCKKDGDEEKEALLDEQPELSLPVEAMFLPALVEVLKETDSVGTAFLQRELKVGYYVASQMITALENLGIIVRENGKQKVVKQKIPLLNAYIKE
jgi:DNA segregation ATPase FtsK/SpoIIIE-like protein